MTKKYFRCDYSKFQSEPFENAVCIPLTKGKHAIIDADDFGTMGDFIWFFQTRGYAVSNRPKPERMGGKTRQRIMHRELIQDCKYVDHINGNKLDNRKANLRPCSASQNQANRAKNAPATSSQYKGVSWYKSYGKWQAYIKHDGVTMCLGYYSDEVEAAKAYDRKAIEIKGNFAKPNFPIAPFTANKK